MLHRPSVRQFTKPTASKPSKSKSKKNDSLSSIKSKSPCRQTSSLKQNTNLKYMKSKTKGAREVLNQLKKEINDMKEEVSKIKSQCSICTSHELKNDPNLSKGKILFDRDMNQMGSVLDPKQIQNSIEVNLQCSEVMESKIKASQQYLFCERREQNKQNQSFSMNISNPVRKRRNQQAEYYIDYYLQN